MLDQPEKTKKSDYLTEAEAADHINVSRSFLRHHRQQGFLPGRARGPNFIRIGRMIRYLRKDLDHWLLEHRYVPRS